ncbi:MAG TPA: hypothetical protein VLB45_04975 [Nitrosopumilaceae archaeon]|nr:hypothetical protein [Nitrosopumilaceae archaeon]
MIKTQDQKWKDEIIAYRKKCQKILLISKSIRYVGLINEYGRTLTGIIKQGTNPMLKAGQVRNEFFLISTMLSMRSTNYSAIGDMDYAVFKHKKVILVVFQRKEGIYYISVDQKVSPDALTKIISNIKKII